MSKNYIFNINELSFLRYIWAIWFRKRVFILSIEVLFPPLKSYLNKIVQTHIRKKKAVDLMEICPELQHARKYRASLLYYNIFRETFDWHFNYYRFDQAQQEIPDYSMAISLTTINYTAGKQEPILLMGEVERIFAPESIQYYGVLQDTVDMFGNYHNRKPLSTIHKFIYPISLFNFFILLLIMIFSILWCIVRIRPFSSALKKYFLTVDFIGDVREIRLAEETLPGGPCLFTVRLKPYIEQFKEAISRFDVIGLGRGSFNITESVKSIAMIIKDSFRLFQLYGTIQTPLFYKIITLPHKRSNISAHLFRYPTQFFWGRDLYNPEHILRRQELHKIGGKSFSYLSGYGALGDIAETLSFISFDNLYILGRVFQRKYERTWPRDMKVIPVGSYYLSREKTAEIRNRDQHPTDIVIFTSYGAVFNDPKLKKFIRELAFAFPERKIWLQLKSYFHENKTAKTFIADCMEGLDNIVYSPEVLEDLINKAGYVFSDPSTIIMESLQFGIPSFVIDVVEKQDYCIYREYPFLCHSEASKSIELIRAIENGEWNYPFDSYRDLAEIPEISIFDQIRSDMGISAAEN